MSFKVNPNSFRNALNKKWSFVQTEDYRLQLELFFAYQLFLKTYILFYLQKLNLYLVQSRIFLKQNKLCFEFATLPYELKKKPNPQRRNLIKKILKQKLLSLRFERELSLLTGKTFSIQLKTICFFTRKDLNRYNYCRKKVFFFYKWQEFGILNFLQVLYFSLKYQSPIMLNTLILRKIKSLKPKARSFFLYELSDFFYKVFNSTTKIKGIKLEFRGKFWGVHKRKKKFSWKCGKLGCHTLDENLSYSKLTFWTKSGTVSSGIWLNVH